MIKTTSGLDYECPECGNPCNITLDHIPAADPEKDIPITVSDCCDVEVEIDMDTDEIPDWEFGEYSQLLRRTKR